MGHNGNGNGNGRYTAEQVIEAFKQTKGMVYHAAKFLGCSHTTVYNYMERYPTVKRAKQAEDGNFGDMCELKLYDAAKEGESWAVQFALRTKFKNRGYAERHEITGADGGALELSIGQYHDQLAHKLNRIAESGEENEIPGEPDG